MPLPSVGPEEDRSARWAVLIVIAVLVGWSALGSVAGSLLGFVFSVVVGLVVACAVWRDRITFDLLSNLALVALPAVVIGLSVT